MKESTSQIVVTAARLLGLSIPTELHMQSLLQDVIAHALTTLDTPLSKAAHADVYGMHLNVFGANRFVSATELHFKAASILRAMAWVNLALEKEAAGMDPSHEELSASTLINFLRLLSDTP